MYVDNKKFKLEYLKSISQSDVTEELKDIFDVMIDTILNKLLSANKLDKLYRIYVRELLYEKFWMNFNINRINERDILFHYFTEVIKRLISRVYELPLH